MEKMSLEELPGRLKALRRGTLSAREIYHTLQACGEMNFQEARPEVERFLKSTEPELRFQALKVLTQYWRLAEHWETARDMLEHDPDEECRFRAANALKSLMMNTQDRRTLTVLARVVRNEQENQVVRESAYAAMRGVLHFEPREQLHLAAHTIDLEKDVDWEMVNFYL